MMKKEKKIGINAILNVIKTSLSVIFPLITYPYALRILGAEGIGKVTYGSSIISYFALIAMLGVSTYAIREGAKRKKNKEDFNKFANELFTINLIFTVISYILLFLSLVFVEKFKEYKFLLILQSLSIILTTIGLDWINIVYEDFLFITVRSIFSHILTLILLFILVHKPEDYYMYALLTVASNGLTCVTNWFYCKKYVNIHLTFHPNFRKHIKPLLLLFMNAITISIYVNFDMTMLGWIKSDYDVGLYALAVKIYTIIKNIMVAVYAVAIPRLAYYIGNNMNNEYKKLCSDIWSYLSLILIPSGIGLICVAPEITLFMGGEEFVSSALALQILAIALIFSIFGGIVTACMNITLNREKDNLISTSISAVLNCLLNLIFIPVFSLYGAAFTTLISEIFVFMYCFIKIPKKERYMNFNIINKSIFHAIVGSVIMFIFSYIIRMLVISSILRLVLIIGVCVIIYFITLFILKNEYLLNSLSIIKHKNGSKSKSQIGTSMPSGTKDM